MRLIRILLVLAFLTLSLLGEQGLLRFYHLKKTSHRLTSENDELRRLNAGLVEEIERLGDPAYLERLIRKEMGYIREGEILLEIPKTP